MRKSMYLLVIFLSVLSCKSIAGSNIIYHINNREAVKIIAEEINHYKSYKKDLFIVMGGSSEHGYQIKIVPTANVNKDVFNNLKVTETKRVLKVNSDYYYIVFATDVEFGVKIKKERGEDPRDTFIQEVYVKNISIHDDASTLYFDEHWNFIERRSLIIFEKE